MTVHPGVCRVQPPTTRPMPKDPYRLPDDGAKPLPAEPVPADMHRMACTLDHEHSAPRCCHASCYCRIEPLFVTGGGNTRDARGYAVGVIAHLPHGLCQTSGMHERRRCKAQTDERGEFRSSRCVFPSPEGKWPVEPPAWAVLVVGQEALAETQEVA